MPATTAGNLLLEYGLSAEGLYFDLEYTPLSPGAPDRDWTQLDTAYIRTGAEGTMLDYEHTIPATDDRGFYRVTIRRP